MNKDDLKKIEYQSWQNGNQWTNEELDFIIKKKCTCDDCGASVEELSDFPELLIEEDELLCEECYGQKYRKLCPICENTYDIIDGESEYSIKTEEDALLENEKAGIYHSGNLLIPININYLKKIDCGESCCEVYSDDICHECVSNLVRKSNYIKSHGSGIPCILIRGYRETLFNDWTDEVFKRKKHHLIHRRITVRGIIEKANNESL